MNEGGTLSNKELMELVNCIKVGCKAEQVSSCPLCKMSLYIAQWLRSSTFPRFLPARHLLLPSDALQAHRKATAPRSLPSASLSLVAGFAEARTQ